MIIDRRLIDRLDRTAAQLALEMADGYQRVEPAGPAAARSFGQGALVALGPGRWVNRSIGIPPPDDQATFDELEGFFVRAGVPPSFEVDTWASSSALRGLATRGFSVEWFRELFVAEPGVRTEEATTAVSVHAVGPGRVDDWVEVFSKAFAGDVPSEQGVAELHARAMESTPSTTHFVATVGSEVVGCGSLSVIDGIAWLGGTATLPAHRGRGVQTALLRHRLQLASDAGCDIAAATAMPGGPSGRNLRRSGFTLVAVQAVMTRPLTGGPS